MVKNNYEIALEDLNKAIELNPKYVDAFYIRGKLKSLTKDKHGAIKDYTEVITLDPKHHGAYFWRAFAKQSINNMQGACADWGSASKLGNEDASDDIEIFCK